MTLMVPPYLIWNRCLMAPLPYMEHISYSPPTCAYGTSHVCMVTPTCMIWWSPLTLYGTGIIWFPHMYNLIFSGHFQKRSTACPKQVECLVALCRTYVEVLLGGQSSSYVQTTSLVFLCCEATGGWECMFWVIFPRQSIWGVTCLCLL